MESHSAADSLPAPTSPQHYCSAATSVTQPITVFQTVWPHFPLTLSYELNVPRPSLVATSDFAGVVLPSRVIPHHSPVIEKPSPKESRTFFLDRSVFDLVDAHPYLALTDPKLLGWYLCLSPEDRKIIQDEGGFQEFLQRHPALELSRHHVYVKYNVGSTRRVGPSMTSTKHTSTMSGAKKCRCGMAHTHLEWEGLPNHLRETLTLLGCSNSRDGSQKHPHEEMDSFQSALNSPTTQEPNYQMFSDSPVTQLNEERPSWQMGSSSSSIAAVCKDGAALASFSVDMELERHREGGQPEFMSQTAITQGQSANFTYTEVSPLQSEWPTVETESPPVDTVAEKDDDEGNLSFEDRSDNFHSIMEDDKSILICLASEDVIAQNNGIQSGPVTTNSDAVAASSGTLKSDQAAIRMDTAEKYTSSTPRITTGDIMVGTELALCMSASTQTEDPATSDKHVITEVHMADLDYLTEEFIKLKMAKEQLTKDKMKSLGCKLREECGCTQRAQQAELCLLALQYSMCRQHCWRLYCISAEGGQLIPIPNNPPANIASVLQKLESDYNHMSDKILAGVPLEQLKPLSVDSDKIATGASYIPAQIVGDVLGTVPSWCSQEPQKHNTSGKENGSLNSQSRNGCQHSQRMEQMKKNSKARRAVTFVPQDRDTNHNANKQEEKQVSKTAAGKELNTSEAWYDAEEDLDPAGPAVAAETGQDPAVITKGNTNESASEEAKSSILCVSNLPSNVTESDVMLWLKKYHASDVSICALKNDLRVAIVMTSGPQSAEATVRELNGCSMQGHTLHVEHINRGFGGRHSQASASVSGPESSEDATKPHTSTADSISTERRSLTQPPLSSSIKNRKVVCISPTAKGTCVPQHYGTMGSFDTLMAELIQRHPDAERQRIVDALMELKAKHQGVLSGLPLRTIRDMTSELLTRPESATQL